MRRLVVLLLAAAVVVGCQKEEEKKLLPAAPVYAPVRLASVSISLVEKPDAKNVLLLGDDAKSLAPVFARAGVKPETTLKGAFDIILVSCGEMTAASCAQAASHLSENGVMAWMMDVRGVTGSRFRAMIKSFALESVHLWMPGEDQWVLVGRKSSRNVKLSAMLEVFAREGAFDDLAKARCGSLVELFASYVGTRADVMPAFALLDLSVEVRPANFLTSKVEPIGWVSPEGVDADIAERVRAEMRSMQVVRRLVVEGNLAADTARDKKGEERATDIWARAYLRNPNDLFLLERIDRLERNAEGFLKVGKVLQAMKCYETIVLIRPNDGSSVRNFGLCLKRIGKLDLAEQVLKRAQELSAAR